MEDFFKKLWNVITAYPTSFEDYVGVGRWLIYKKFLLILAVIAVLLTGLLLWWFTGQKEKPFENPQFYYFEDKLKVFSGEAVLLDESDCVVYRGQISKGLCTGRGKEFSPPNEALVYEGDFLGNFYSGQGKLYEYGNLLYEGGFLNGQYSGIGTLFKKNEPLYSGSFAEGMYNGKGILNDGEKLLYDGEFASGLYEGEGTLYDESGCVVYTGEFKGGKYSGNGVLTAPNGVTIYEGGFLNGLYDGEGSLYSDGGVRLTLKGTFVSGSLSREGSLYNPQGQLLYSGNICSGVVDYIGLLGLPLVEMLERVKEVPAIYYSGGYVGYLFHELGFAAVTRYDYSGFQASGEETLPMTGNTELFSSASDNLVFSTILVEGSRIYEQIPTKQTVDVTKTALTGFEAFMESRLGGFSNYAYIENVKSAVVKRGDHLYEVEALPEEVKYDGKGVFSNDIYYYYRAGMVDKEEIPEIVICNKAKYGG